MIPIETENHQGTKKANKRNTILLRRGSNPNRNLFLVHDGTGRIEGYFKLSTQIYHEFNVYGIALDEMIGFIPQNIAISDIARKYVNQIKLIQPSGPYFVGGWSIGGTIAFEMAGQLEQEGEVVGLCALFDTPPPGYYLPDCEKEFSVATELDSVSRFITNEAFRNELESSYDINQFWNLINDKLTLGDFDKQSFVNQVEQVWGSVILNLGCIPLQQLFYGVNVIRTLHKARALYIPERIVKVPVHVFNAEESELLNISGWNKYCSHAVNRMVRGDHYSIFSEQNLKTFTEEFNKVLDSIR